MFVVTAWRRHCFFLYIARAKLGSSNRGHRIQDLRMKLVMLMAW